MAKYKWADEYTKKGSDLFGEEAIKSLRMVKKKYTQDYMSFFSQLDDMYAGMRMTQDRKQINQVISDLKEIGFIIDKLLTVKNVKEGNEDTGRLYELMDAVDSGFKYYSNPSNLSVPLQKRIQEVEKKSGVKVADIAKANQAIKGRVAESGSRLKRKEEPFYAEQISALGDFLKPAATQLLGPFGNVAELGGKAIGGISGMLKKRREQKIDLKRRAFAQSTLLAGEETPENFSSAYRNLAVEGIGPLRQNINMPRSYRRSAPRATLGGLTSAFSTSADRKQEKMRQDSTKKSLWNFFNKDAFRAKWTKELLSSVKGEFTVDKFSAADVAKKGIGGVLKSFFAGLAGGTLVTKLGALRTALVGVGTYLVSVGSKLVSFLWRVLGIVGAIYAGYKIGSGAGKLLMKHFPKATYAVSEAINPFVWAGKGYYGARNWWTERGQKKTAENRARSSMMHSPDAEIPPEILSAYPDARRNKNGFIETGLPPAESGFNRVKPEAIPVSGSSDVGVIEELKKSNSSLKSSVDYVGQEVKKLGDMRKKDFVSGVDTDNTRDPLVQSLKAGFMGV